MTPTLERTIYCMQTKLQRVMCLYEGRLSIYATIGTISAVLVESYTTEESYRHFVKAVAH